MNIGIIGIGTVGSAIATAIYNSGAAREIVLYDRDTPRAAAAAADLGNAATFGAAINLRVAATYRDMRNCDIVIIAAGANQKSGQTRMDLRDANTNVMRDIVPKLMKFADAKKLILIVVTNPLDVMTALVQKLSGLPENRVIGTGTMLDSARYKMILARLFSVSPSSVDAYVLGEHGDSSVLNWESAAIGGIPLNDFARQMKNPITNSVRASIDARVKNAGYEIMRGRGATWDGIAAATADLVECIANDQRRILTISTGRGSLPRIVGASGVITSLMPKMSATEKNELKKSERIIRKNTDCVI
ncbi:MAG: NAD(P)-binding domain-containing protein [Rickettsiales bacterium]|jgi:L-lactate dehydrogenase|nr:NAD(P)-binding domain-containing protein [Rickettsiales bacterium]